MRRSLTTMKLVYAPLRWGQVVLTKAELYCRRYCSLGRFVVQFFSEPRVIPYDLPDPITEVLQGHPTGPMVYEEPA